MSACAPSPILASHYDQHCDKNSDCVVVEVGSPCGCAGAFDSVNVDAQQSVENDFKNDKALCPQETTPVHCNALPQTNHPICDQHQCLIPSKTAPGDPCAVSEGCVGTP